MFNLILAAAVAAAQPVAPADAHADHGKAHGQMCPECMAKGHKAAMTADECKECCKDKPEAERAACMAQHGQSADKHAGHHQH